MVLPTSSYRKASSSNGNESSSEQQQQQQPSKTVKRLANKLNSYKDSRFHPYVLDANSIGSIDMSAVLSQSGQSVMASSSFTAANASSSSSSAAGVFGHHNNNAATSNAGDFFAEFGFDPFGDSIKLDFNKDYFVWDNIVNRNLTQTTSFDLQRSFFFKLPDFCVVDCKQSYRYGRSRLRSGEHEAVQSQIDLFPMRISA